MERIGGVWTAHGKNARIGGEKKKRSSCMVMFWPRENSKQDFCAQIVPRRAKRNDLSWHTGTFGGRSY